jgi:hypothetical protein
VRVFCVMTGLIKRLVTDPKWCRKHCYMYAWLHFWIYQLLQCYKLAVIADGIYAPEMNQLPNSWAGHSGGRAW